MLSERIAALRMRLFARVNGDGGVPIPGPLVGVEHFRDVYAHPAADGRSEGAALSDLFWYWLSPGAELHQEHLEPGPRYFEVAQATRRILGLRRGAAQELAARCAASALGRDRVRLVRLRDLMMPLWAAYFYEVVFGEPCPPRARRLIVGHADDVVTSLKCSGLRHMRRRHRLTRYLAGRLESGGVPHDLPPSLRPGEQALYLQGTFFNTAVVQMSEAMAHLLLVLARHPRDQERIAAGDAGHLDRVMEETFRLYPLFGIAHRITSADIVVSDRVTLPRGSVVCFDYPAYHRSGHEDPDGFDPDRWLRTSPRRAGHIPFGEPANRPCPAWRLAPIAMRAVVREVLRRYELRSSAAHARALPNRGPCLLVPRGRGFAARPAVLAFIRARDRVEDPLRSARQLVLGAYMVWHARRLALATRHFAGDGRIRTREKLNP